MSNTAGLWFVGKVQEAGGFVDLPDLFICGDLAKEHSYMAMPDGPCPKCGADGRGAVAVYLHRASAYVVSVDRLNA